MWITYAPSDRPRDTALTFEVTCDQIESHI